jgi:hypothetical protein
VKEGGTVDVQATSTFDAAHLFVVEAKKERAVGLTKPTLATVFEVVTAGKIYHVSGAALQRWIVDKSGVAGKDRRSICFARGQELSSRGVSCDCEEERLVT